MNLWFRLIGVVLASMFRPRLGFLDESVLRFRVWPLDLDVNLHMTNSRYLALMDVGRVDMLARSGLWRHMLRERWSPVVAAAFVRFRKPLALLQPIILRSRLITWDEKWMYFDQRVEVEGAVACHAVFRTAFVHDRKVVPPEDIAARIGTSMSPPEGPVWLDAWRAFDQSDDGPFSNGAPAAQPVDDGR